MTKTLESLRTVALGALLGFVSLAWSPAARANDRYLALVVKSPKATYAATVATLEQALGQAPTGTWADHALYSRTAKRLHVRDPYNAKSAQRIGREAGLTEVLFVTLRTTVTDGDSRTFADIELVDVARGAALIKRTYFLPERRMSEGTAAYVADFLSMRQGGAPEADVAAVQDAPRAPATFVEMRGRDLDDVPAPSVTTHRSTSSAKPSRSKDSPMSLLRGIF